MQHLYTVPTPMSASQKASQPVTILIDYMGYALRLHLPVTALSASLMYFVCIDAFPLVPPAYLPSSCEQSLIDGPTLENIERYNLSSHTWTMPRSPGFLDIDLPISSTSSLSQCTCYDWDWVRGMRLWSTGEHEEEQLAGVIQRSPIFHSYFLA
jgi:hypothetical protein